MRKYTMLSSARFAKEGEAPVAVALPHTWNAQDGQDGGSDYWRGTGRYWIDLPNPTANKRQFIEFQGANHIATVYCNGVLLGCHKGGFSTFRFELTQCLKPTDNELLVEVFNGVCDVYPQQADFTFFGGLYRSVSFVETELAHFDMLKNGTQGVFITPSVNGDIRLDLFPVDADNCTVSVDILDAQDCVVASSVAHATEHTVMMMQVNRPHLWNGLADPYCYRAEARLLRDNQVLDSLQVSFGFREFSVNPSTGFWLNGKNVPLRGVSRHQDRADKGWAISREDHLQDVNLIRQMGANTIRLAHYQHDSYFYDLCDRYGFVVWAEIPFISTFLKGLDAHDNTIRQMTELIAQCYNHPSICFWGICNEISIGGVCEEQVQNMQDLHNLCKKLDPSRLTTLAHVGSVHPATAHTEITDVQSFNYYMGWYEGTVDQNGQYLDAWHEANPDRPCGLSEYGADNYTCWHSANPFNHDYTEEYALWYHHEMIKTIQARPYLWATHVWNMFDFAVDERHEGGFKGINAKGLVTHDRKICKDSYYLYKAYWNPEPMVHICGRRFADRAPGERNVTVLTNEDAVTLICNGVLIGSQPAKDHMVVFENVPLADGKNTLEARSANGTDTIVLNGVKEHNPAYDVPDLAAALSAGNWFTQQTDDGEPENYYSLEMPLGPLLDNEECLRIVRGWFMSGKSVNRVTGISRLTRYQETRRDWKLTEIPSFRELMTQEEFDLLDRMLRKVKKPNK